MIDLESRLQEAIQHFWSMRERQQQTQIEEGRTDVGTRGAVTGGKQMAALEGLVSDILVTAGIQELDIKTHTALELPGYYRSEKKWDLIVVSRGQLVAVVEFKSQVGPSFGNNFNNRAEEAIGSATDLWLAYREGRFGAAPAPFLGYFFLLEDCPRVHQAVRNQEPHFLVDPVFSGASYSRRYELFCRRLVLERLYHAACPTLASRNSPYQITHPAEDLCFRRFTAALRGHAVTFLDAVR